MQHQPEKDFKIDPEIKLMEIKLEGLMKATVMAESSSFATLFESVLCTWRSLSLFHVGIALSPPSLIPSYIVYIF